MASKDFQTYQCRTTSHFPPPIPENKAIFSQGIGFTSNDGSMWESITTKLSVQEGSVQTLEIRVARLENMFHKTMDKIDVLISMIPILQTIEIPNKYLWKKQKKK